MCVSLVHSLSFEMQIVMKNEKSRNMENDIVSIIDVKQSLK